MRVEISFNINFDIKKIINATGKSREEFFEFIDKNLLEQVTSILNYELAEGDMVTITNGKIINID